MAVDLDSLFTEKEVTPILPTSRLHPTQILIHSFIHSTVTNLAYFCARQCSSAAYPGRILAGGVGTGRRQAKIPALVVLILGRDRE